MDSQVGQRVEYWSQSREAWHPTSIVDQMVEDGKVHVKVQVKNKFFPTESPLIRWSPDDLASSRGAVSATVVSDTTASVAGTEIGQTMDVTRERGQHDTAAKTLAVSIFQTLVGVYGMLQKWSDSWALQERREELKTKLLQIFPKDATPGVCYVPFNTIPPPGKVKVKGNLHPRAQSHYCRSVGASRTK